MKRLALLFSVVMLVAGCRQDQSVQPVAAVDSESSATTKGAVAKPQSTVASQIKITFNGTICHVLQGAKTPRAVIVKGTNMYPHEALIKIPLTDFKQQPPSAPFTCDKFGNCQAVIAVNSIIRLLDGETPLNSGPEKDPGGAFDLKVPHLKTIAKDLNAKLKDAIINMDPVTENDFVAGYFELPHGSFGTSSYGSPACFSNDKTTRDFGRDIVLMTDAVTPVLQIKVGAAAPARFELVAAQPVDIEIVNRPTRGGHSSPDHFVLHYKIADWKVMDKPSVLLDCRSGSSVPSAEGEHPKKEDDMLLDLYGEVPGCSNTQWP